MQTLFYSFLGILISLSIWFVDNYQAILAYSKRELGLIPMMYLNSSFDTWFMGGAIIGAVIGISQSIKKVS